MLKQSIYILLAFIFFFATPSLYACKPCAKDLIFEEAVKQADLIIVGRKIAEGPRTDTPELLYGGPDWITVQITQTIKGNPEKTEILVNSWDAMCNYGIVVDDKSFVMLLAKKKGPVDESEYDAVNNGCSVKTYLLDEGSVVMDSRKLPLTDFIEKIKQLNQ